MVSLRGWLAEAGTDIDLEFLVKFTDQSLTSVDPRDPWYEAMTRAFVKVKPQIFPAGYLSFSSGHRISSLET